MRIQSPIVKGPGAEKAYFQTDAANSLAPIGRHGPHEGHGLHLAGKSHDGQFFRTIPDCPKAIIDLFHSILENVGIPHDSKARGKNLLEGEFSPIFSETHSISGESGPEFRKRFGTDLYTLIQNNHKLIYSSKQTYELYDLSNDPSETRNLAAGSLVPDDEITLARMKTQLASWMNQTVARELRPKALPAETHDQIRSRLNALGYIQ